MKLLGFLVFLFYAVILLSIVTSANIPIIEIIIVNFILITNIAFRKKVKKEINK